MPDSTPKMTGLTNVLEMLKVLDDPALTPPKPQNNMEATQGFPDALRGDEVLCSYSINIEQRATKDGRIYSVASIKGTVPAIPQLVIIDLMQVVESLIDKKEF